MVVGIFVVESTLEKEAGSRNMRNDPLSLPFGICVFVNGRGTQEKIGILLMSLRKADFEGRMNVWIG